jgi:hypothetical protein
MNPEKCPAKKLGGNVANAATVYEDFSLRARRLAAHPCLTI